MQLAENGDAGIIDYGQGVEFEEIIGLHEKYNFITPPAFNSTRWPRFTNVFIDNNYAGRSIEVRKISSAMYYHTCIGKAEQPRPFLRQEVDVFEGRGKSSGRTVPEVTWSNAHFKPIAHNLLRGIHESYKLRIFKNPPRDLIYQLVSEEYKAGAWVPRRGHSANHLWDCFVLCCLGATMLAQALKSEW